MKYRLFLIIATSVVLGSTTSCSWDDGLAYPSDNDQKTPISFNVNVGTLPNPEVSTRGYTTGAANNSGYTFSGGEYIAVGLTHPSSSDEVIKQYTVGAGSSGGNALTYQKEADGTTTDNTFDWLSTSETGVSIRAWSDGVTKTVSTPVVDPHNQAFTIEKTQSGDVKELLYSAGSYDYTTSAVYIPLYHQLARFVIKINDETTGTPSISVAIGHNSSKVPTKATFAKPTSTTTNFGSWSSQTDLDVITAKEESPAAGYEYTYSAVVIPDGATTTYYPADMRLINITIGSETFVYKPTSALHVEPGKQYNFIITIKNRIIEVETSIADWDPVVSDASIQFIPPVDIKKNPLWYVSEKNVNYDGANYSFATNDNEGYFFSWNDAVKNFTTTANAPLATPNTITSYTLGTGSKIEGWHLPTLNEWNSIVPGATTSDTQLNIWNIVASDGSGRAFSETGNTVNVCFGYNNETRGTMTEKSYWYRKSNTELYAIRYCESDYCSAWKYEFTENSATAANPSVLTVSCTLLDAPMTVAEAESEYGTDDAKWGTITFGDDEAAGAVQRVFLARGHADDSASVPNGASDGTNGSFWSSTLVSTNANAAWDMGLLLGNVGVFHLNNGNHFGRNVRLFRDKSDYTPSKAKTTIPLATTSNIAVGDIVCSDGSIYAAANAAYVASEGKTPIGIIAYVNNEGDAGATTDIGNATTEKGKGRNRIKSLGRALVLCAMNIGGTANNATVGTLYQAGPRYGTLVQEGDNNLATSLYYWGFERTQGMNSVTYPAAQAAYNFSTLAAPDCTTGWFLPSAGQWKKILNYVAGIDVADNKPLIHTWYSPLSDYASNINTKLDYLTAAGATIVNTIPLVEHHYWSSTNYSTTTDNTYNGLVCNPSSGIAIGGYWGTESYYVRPVLAF